MPDIGLATESLYFFGIVYFLLEMVAIYYAFHAILNTRTSQAAIAWAISLIIIPLLILPLYWVFGYKRFHGYRDSFRQAKLDDIETARVAFEQIKQYHVNDIAGLQSVTRTVSNLQHLPFTSHNSTKLLINGESTYKAMFKSIIEAKDYVLLQFYIIKNDHVGEEFRRLLTEKMRQGVRVYFLYDSLGSYSLSARYLQELRDAGAHVSSFNERKGISKYLHINFRNHRKILIVDGLKAFVGGLNLGLEYLGEDASMGYWRDTHVMLEGPSVQVTQGVFVKDWYWSVGSVPELNWTIEAPDKCSGEQNILILDTGPADNLPVCSLFLCALINQAKERLWLATPYFVPDSEVINALKNAALRGVDVRLILPEKYDHYFIYLTSFAYYRELQGYDIKIFRYTKGFSHQKVILLDGVLAGVGTVNLDNRSIHLNFEIVAYVADKEFAQQVAQMLEYDLKHCYLDNIDNFQDRPWWFKAVSRLFYLLSPIL